MKADELMQVVEGKKKAVIVDVRTAGEYEGTDIRALRGGHMPTAVNIDYARNFDPEIVSDAAALGTETDLQGHPCRQPRHHPLPDRGSVPHTPTLSCRALGYTDVAIYHDGWRVYGSNLNLPVESETWFDFNKVNRTMKAVQELQEEME